MTRLALTDQEWQSLYTMLKNDKGIYVHNETDTRRFVEGVLWILRTGAQWRTLPERYGHWNTVYHRYADWSEKGIWPKLLNQVAYAPDREWIIPDSTIVRAHPCAAGAPHTHGGQAHQALGRSGGGFSTKIHVLTDALGFPLRILLTGGQVHDVSQAETLLSGQESEYVIGDKGYASAALVPLIVGQGAIPVIPSHPRSLQPQSYDRHLYKERHAVECFFNKLKHYRRVFARFDKLESRFLSFVCLATVLIWLR